MVCLERFRLYRRIWGMTEGAVRGGQYESDSTLQDAD